MIQNKIVPVRQRAEGLKTDKNKAFRDLAYNRFDVFSDLTLCPTPPAEELHNFYKKPY